MVFLSCFLGWRRGRPAGDQEEEGNVEGMEGEEEEGPDKEVPPTQVSLVCFALAARQQTQNWDELLTAHKLGSSL